MLISMYEVLDKHSTPYMKRDQLSCPTRYSIAEVADTIATHAPVYPLFYSI